MQKYALYAKNMTLIKRSDDRQELEILAENIAVAFFGPSNWHKNERGENTWLVKQERPQEFLYIVD